MLFTSLDFGIFLPIVFLLYWFVFQYNYRLQNLLIVAASYLFYGWWDVRFLILILVSTAVDYSIGWALENAKEDRRRKLLLATSVLVNLGLLGFFKYYNFFIENFAAAFTFFGTPIDPWSLNLILPLGISFYTFQTLSYTIDIYRGDLKPTKDPIQFMAFVSFFPQLEAGPIERARDLLPQFSRKRTFEPSKAVDGCRQILWGFVKKVVVGDNCAKAIDFMFDNPTEVESGDLFLGAILFLFRVYGDFSGYSDIAIGTARLFGFNLTQNFAFPYFSRNIIEFWRRWHITLSTWLRDYLFIPLGGSRGGHLKTIRNVLITFLLCGFWHGPDWKYIVWGGLHGLYLVISIAMPFTRRYKQVVAHDSLLPSFREFTGMVITFLYMAFVTVFFRAETAGDAVIYLQLTFSDPLSWFSWDIYSQYDSLLLTIFIFLLFEWKGRRETHALAKIGWKWPRPFRWSMYMSLAILVIYFLFSRESVGYIYFQF